jgi:hypothetical protein
MADLTMPPAGEELLPVGDGWFDRLARVTARGSSRREALRLAAGVTATAMVASWVRPSRGVAAGDADCSGTRTAYSAGCAKPVDKLNYTASFNGCGPENGINVVPNSPLGIATFTEPCNKHDLCYGKCNSSKATCDSDFFNRMKAVCIADYPGNGILDVVGRGYCLNLAQTYTTAVSLGGANAFNAAQTAACDCCNECPGGQAQCGGKCCQTGQVCSNGACCFECDPGYIKCSYPAPAGTCDYGCCNGLNGNGVCCPKANGLPRCCPSDLCCNGVCTTC